MDIKSLTIELYNLDIASPSGFNGIHGFMQSFHNQLSFISDLGSTECSKFFRYKLLIMAALFAKFLDTV